MKSSESIINIAKALNKAQAELGSVVKGSNNPYYDSKYADINDVIKTIKETLNKNDITFIQPLMVKEVAGLKVTVVETVLLHNTGEYISSETEVVTKDNGDAQKYGAAITYSRRFGLQSIVGLPAEDDDGNTATGKAPKTPPATASTTKNEAKSDSPTKFSNRGQKLTNTAPSKPQANKGDDDDI
jgi:hypothetical protein